MNSSHDNHVPHLAIPNGSRGEKNHVLLPSWWARHVGAVTDPGDPGTGQSLLHIAIQLMVYQIDIEWCFKCLPHAGRMRPQWLI